MRRLVSIMAALCLAVGNTAALAEGGELRPGHDVRIETVGTEDCTVRASFDPSRINEQSRTIFFDVYGQDLYQLRDVMDLQPGDQICTGSGAVTVREVEPLRSGYIINGGLDSEDGLELVWAEDDANSLYSVQRSGYFNATALGQAGCRLADTVTVDLYRGSTETEVILPAEDVKAYLMQLAAPDDPAVRPVVFDQSIVNVTLLNGEVAAISIGWIPEA